MKTLTLDPRHKGDFVIKSELSGWLGRKSYVVRVVVIHRPTGQTLREENATLWESRWAIERRALRLLGEVVASL